MQTPVHKKGMFHPKKFEKKCLYTNPDGSVCGAHIYGAAITKYCVHHREVLAKKSRYVFSTDSNINKHPANITMVHSNENPIRTLAKCNICGEEFERVIIPGVFVYAARCILHRNSHKAQISYHPKQGEVYSQIDETNGDHCASSYNLDIFYGITY